MLLDQLGQPVIDLAPDLARHHGFERRGGNFESEVARPNVAGVDDPTFGGGRAVRAGADQKARDRLDRLLGRRQADPQQAIAAKGGQALERQRQMRAALVRRQRVDLVDDHRAGRRQHRPAGFGAEQDVERFGGGDDDVRRGAAHLCALARRGVAGAHPGPDLDIGQALRLQGRADAGQRRLQIAPDIVRQRLQWRDVDDLRRVFERAGEPLPHQPVDRCEKGGERLARPRRRGDQGVSAGANRRPRLRLRRGRRGKAPLEPPGNRRMKQRGQARGTDRSR